MQVCKQIRQKFIPLYYITLMTQVFIPTMSPLHNHPCHASQSQTMKQNFILENPICRGKKLETDNKSRNVIDVTIFVFSYGLKQLCQDKRGTRYYRYWIYSIAEHFWKEISQNQQSSIFHQQCDYGNFQTLQLTGYYIYRYVMTLRFMK